MVKSYSALILFLAVSAAYDDAEAMLQVGSLNSLEQGLDSSYKQAHDMEVRFQQLAADAAHSGETPSLPVEALDAVKGALATLEAEIKQEKRANDLSWSQAIQALKQCDELMKLAFTKPGGVNEYSKSMTDARGTHATCRGIEDKQRGHEKKACEAQDEFAEKANTSPLKTTNKYNCDQAKPGAPVGDVKAFKKYLQAMTDWGVEFNDPLALKMEFCRTKSMAADKTAKKCDVDQSAFQVNFCEYEVILSTTCAAQTECYEAQMRNLIKVKAQVQAKEKSEKIMWKSTQKVRCFLVMLDKKTVRQDGYDKCMKLVVDTTHLDIKFPNDHTRATCDLSPVMTKPGDDAWKKAEYDALAPKQSWKTVSPWAKGLEPVTSCLAAPKPKPPWNFDLLQCQPARLEYPGFHDAVAVSEEGAAEACSQICKSKGSSSFVLAQVVVKCNCFCSAASLLELEGRPRRGPPPGVKPPGLPLAPVLPVVLQPGADGCTVSECFDGNMKPGTSCTAKFIVGPKCKLSATWNAASDGEANMRTYTACLRRESEDGLQFALSTNAQGNAEMMCEKFPLGCAENAVINDWGFKFTDLCPSFCKKLQFTIK